MPSHKPCSYEKRTCQSAGKEKVSLPVLLQVEGFKEAICSIAYSFLHATLKLMFQFPLFSAFLSSPLPSQTVSQKLSGVTQSIFKFYFLIPAFPCSLTSLMCLLQNELCTFQILRKSGNHNMEQWAEVNTKYLV